MPRKRKPLATQKGNLTVAQQEDKKLEERLVQTGKETLAKPPTWLIDAKAKNEFKYRDNRRHRLHRSQTEAA